MEGNDSFAASEVDYVCLSEWVDVNSAQAADGTSHKHVV